MVEKLKPKYNCFQRVQRLRDCDGQALYLADRVDGIVLEVVRELFSSIRQTPRDKILEQKIRQEYHSKRKEKAALERKLQDCEKALERYEGEVLRCLEGRSNFSQEMLARLIAKAEADLNQTRQEYAKTLQQAEDGRKLAPLARKRVILSQLLDRVELGKGYQVTLHLKFTYRQFLELTRQEKVPQITRTKM